LSGKGLFKRRDAFLKTLGWGKYGQINNKKPSWHGPSGLYWPGRALGGRAGAGGSALWGRRENPRVVEGLHVVGRVDVKGELVEQVELELASGGFAQLLFVFAIDLHFAFARALDVAGGFVVLLELGGAVGQLLAELSL
jgi:hypothetical protein